MSEYSLGSTLWAKELKKKAVTISKAVTTNYVELAKLLYTLDTTYIDNNPENPKVYFAWGYSDLKHFAEKELHLEARRYQYIKKIGHTLCEKLKDADPQLVQRFVDLGWTKVREINRVLKPEQLKDWVEKAENATFMHVSDMVARYIQDEGKIEEPNAEALDIKQTVSLTPVPPVENIQMETFALYDDQLNIVKSALNKAKELSGSNKKSYNLSLICTEFLATGDSSLTTEEQKLKILAQIEKNLGYKLIAVDADSYEINYGIETLKNVAMRGSKEQEVEEECYLSQK